MKKLVKKIFEIDSIIFILLILVSLGSVYYLLLPGFYEPQDLHHIADIYQMYRAIASGQIPPRWGPDFLYAFGYPLFNFYYVGPFYLGALFYFVFGSLRLSYELVFIFSVVVGTVGFYYFLKNHFSKIASYAGAVLFTYTPYKAVQIYVRGAMGELLSLSLMPWFFYFMDRYISERKRKWYIFSVLISVGIILSHNYFWVLIFGFYGTYVLFVSFLKKRFDLIWNFLLGIFLSLGVTTYWWLPALVEQKLLNTQTPFPLIDHFPFIKQLIIPSWGYGASLWGPSDGMSFQLGAVNVLVVIISLVVFLIVKKKKHLSFFIWAFMAFLICLFFMNERSYFIWRMIPFYNLFQFPWRLLSFTTFFSSVLAAFVVDNLSNNRAFSGKFSALIIMILSVLLTFGYFKPSQIFYKSDDDYLNRMFANRTSKGEKKDISQDYVNYSEDYLLLPKWMDKKPDFLPEEKFMAFDKEAVEVQTIREITPVSWEADVTVDTPGKLNFYVLNFPGWNVDVNGKKTDIYSGDSGQIVIDLNKGDTIVKAYWSETTLRKIADVISVGFLMIVLGFYCCLA